MSAYGFSVWYVFGTHPSAEHILHMTVATQMTLEQAYAIYFKIPDSIVISPKGEMVAFAKMYDNDPLYAVGWYVNYTPPILEILHTPHMSVQYSEVPQISLPYDILRPYPRECAKAIVDTQSLDPKLWRIIKQSL